jgi:hypothetical protein
MTSTMTRKFDNPDEVRTPPKSKVEVVDVAGATVARLSLDPGWRWSEVIKPIVGTETCQLRHFGVLLSGTMHVMGADGAETEIDAGSAYVIEPGHDAWVVGDTPVNGFEFESPTAATFATPASQ